MGLRKCLSILCFVSVAMFAAMGQAAGQTGQAAETQQAAQTGPFKVILRGTVHDRPQTKQMYLLDVPKKGNSGSNIDSARVIPVVDGRFEFEFSGDEMKMFELTPLEEYESGMWVTISFFPDAPVVEFNVYPMDRNDDNSVSGGELTKEFTVYKDELQYTFADINEYERLEGMLDSMSENGTLFNEAYNAIEREYRAEPDRAKAIQLKDRKDKMIDDMTAYTDEATKILSELWDMGRNAIKLKYEYITDNPGLVSYSLMVKDIYYQNIGDEVDPVDYTRAFDKLSAVFPDHSWTEYINTMLNASLAVRPGGKFIDFSAPEIDGTMHMLSKEIEGKVAVINLWASWCGSCIDHARLLKPLYERYKDKGFTIVGMAREFKNTAAYVNILGMEKYPWLNLVDVDDKIGAATKYGASNVGGLMLLVDRNGTIVYVDPTADEIREYLEKSL